MEDKTIFTETYKVRSTQVNLNNQLGLYGVLGMLQDIAAEHASLLGVYTLPKFLPVWLTLPVRLAPLAKLIISISSIIGISSFPNSLIS